MLGQVGAGISTSAGIPDFRSPETGLYANLAKLNLPRAEDVFDINFFRKNPLPFFTLAHELYPGRFKPTLSHSFIRLLSDKGLLLKLFTQNIDCLDREAGVPEDKIVEAHGSFARHSCIDCHASYPEDLMKKAIDAREVPHCQTPQCNGLAKPEIVFFGEPLPEEFHRNRSLPSDADLCIVMGTSLSVQPFASLPGFCENGVPRVLINLERVGGLGSRTDDVLLLGDCDTGVRNLANFIGWEEELETLWKATNGTEDDSEAEPKSARSKDEKLDDRIASLTDEVEKSLKISSNHNRSIRNEMAEEMNKRCPNQPAPDELEKPPKVDDTGATRNEKNETESSAKLEATAGLSTAANSQVKAKKQGNAKASVDEGGSPKPSL